MNDQIANMQLIQRNARALSFLLFTRLIAVVRDKLRDMSKIDYNPKDLIGLINYSILL